MNKKKSLSNKKIVAVDNYSALLNGVSGLLQDAQIAASRSINTILSTTYWEIGRRIIEFEQHGLPRATYGEKILKRLALDLSSRFGRGFGLSNLKLIKKFYLVYQDRSKSQTVSGLFGITSIAKKSQTVSGFSSNAPKIKVGIPGIPHELSITFPLSWSQYVRLLNIEEPQKRNFYEEESLRCGWSVRQLDRQIDSMLYEQNKYLC